MVSIFSNCGLPIHHIFHLLLFEIVTEQCQRRQFIHRDVEKTLYLRGMQVNG